jgi:hypothetical protein
LEESESLEKDNSKPQRKVKDKKRIAVCSNALGRENRSLIRGQVVDMGISDFTKADDLWDLMTGLMQGKENEITPFLDFSLAPVRKPILKIEIFNEKEKLIYESQEFLGDEDGFFSHEIHEKFKAGIYIYFVTFKGSDSYRQYTKDLAFLNLKERSEITKVTIVGKGILRILSEKYNSYITTSDIDQTYLATQLGSKKGLLSALFETPEEKISLPGMPVFYNCLRKDSNDSPLVFISASPHYFRRSISMTIKNHGIKYESLHLKYLNGTVKGVIDKITFSVLNINELLKEGVDVAWERAKKFFGSTYQSLFDQLSYKLSTLLHSRIYQPTKSKEILLGDNTESDYFIFTIYQYILLGLIRGKDLEDYLYKLNFLGRDAVTRDYAKRICNLQEECLSIHGEVNSVHSVLINMTNLGPMAFEMEENVKKALPPNLPSDQIKNYIPTEGALGFATNLTGLGVLEFQSVLDVTVDLTGKWLNGKVLDEKYLLSLARNLSVVKKAENQKQELYKILKEALD